MADKVVCTMVFEIDRDNFKKMNPLTTETPWGIPYAIALGDALEEADELREKLERAAAVGNSRQSPSALSEGRND
jgi:hypothetical protein